MSYIECLDQRLCLSGTSSISGTLFNDVNGNGVRDAADAGEAGRTVYLDVNNNKRIDVGELKATSGATGAYRFSNLAAGTYHVREVLPTGRIGTAPFVGVYTIKLVAGGASIDNFGDRSRVNFALHKTVIDGSGSFDGAFNAAGFSARNVTDGSTTDVHGQTYWLGRNGVANEYFTLDLGVATPIAEIELRNTHNDIYNDRGTKAFAIFASTSVDGAHHLVNPVLVLSGQLSNVTGKTPIPADKFTAGNGLTVAARKFRYLKFQAISST